MANASLAVWVLQTGEPMPLPGSTGRPMRGMQLASALVEAGHDVLLWTSDFEHSQHRAYFGESTRIEARQGLRVQTIASPGYARNVGLARLWDHALLGRELSRLLRAESGPDVAFIGFPPIETSWVMARWLARRSIPFVVDCKDQWPDILSRGVPRWAAPISRLALHPYNQMAIRTLGLAGAVTSISEPFLNWSLAKAGRSLEDGDHRVFPLTAADAPVDNADMAEAAAWWDDQGISADGRFRVVFVGSLSTAFNFEPLVEASKNPDIDFVICGTGSREEEVRALLRDRQNVLFPGWVDFARVKVLLARASVALAPYERLPDFQMSLPNKYFDSLASAVPLVTSLDGELGSALERTQTGRVYDPNEFGDLRVVLERLLADPSSVAQLAANCRAIYDRQYSPRTIYGQLVELVESIAPSKP